MKTEKQGCNCQEYAHIIERLTRLEEQRKYELENITRIHQEEYEKNRKILEKISGQYTKIANFLKIIAWLFKTKKRIALILFLRFAILTVWFMYVDSWNSSHIQYGKLDKSITKFLWELVKMWNEVR